MASMRWAAGARRLAGVWRTRPRARRVGFERRHRGRGRTGSQAPQRLAGRAAADPGRGPLPLQGHPEFPRLLQAGGLPRGAHAPRIERRPGVATRRDPLQPTGLHRAQPRPGGAGDRLPQLPRRLRNTAKHLSETSPVSLEHGRPQVSDRCSAALCRQILYHFCWCNPSLHSRSVSFLEFCFRVNTMLLPCAEPCGITHR